MSFIRTVRTLATPLIIVTVAACSGDDGTGPEEPGFGTVVIQLDHAVAGSALQMHTGTYTNAAGNQYSVSKLEYTVSAFTLQGGAGSAEHASVHYRDADDASTATLTLEDVPSGAYSTLSFTHGIAAAANAAGAFPDLDNQGMAWPAMMGGGYHYMRNEGTFTTNTGEVGNFTTHTGPTMGNDFSFPVSLSLPSGFEVPKGGTVTIHVQMDVNEWYTNPNTWDFNDYGLIMGNMAAQNTLKSNGASVWSIASVD